MERDRGKFVVVEGGVGSGKTTQLFKIKDCVGVGKEWTWVREPGSTVFGERIRNAVQGLYTDPIEPYAALLAYSSARANLIRGLVIPKIEGGISVGQDRYWYSTWAYQGAEGVSKPIIWFISMIATRMFKPDLVLHYDLLPEIGMARKTGQPDLDRYDTQLIKFHQKVRNNYHQLRRLYPGIWRVIDASKGIEEVFEDTKKILREFDII